MGKQIIISDMEYEYMEGLLRASLINIVPIANIAVNPFEVDQDSLGETLFSRFVTATTVPDPGPVGPQPGLPTPGPLVYSNTTDAESISYM